MPEKTVGVFSLLVAIVSATLLTVGMATSYWSKDGSGLWNGCSHNVCVAVQATMVISTFFGIVHVLVLFLHVKKQIGQGTRRIITCAFINALLAVIFGVVSIIMYALKTEADKASLYGWSFALVLVGIGITFFNLFLILLEGSNQRAAGAYSSI